MQKNLCKTLAYFIIFCAAPNLAAASVTYKPNYNFQAGTGNTTRSEIDALLPISGDKNGLIYVDINAQTASDKSRYGGVGIGARQISGDKIFGLYGFLDRNQTITEKQTDNWLILNIGAELITQNFDTRFNFYAPASANHKSRYGDQLYNFDGTVGGSIGQIITLGAPALTGQYNAKSTTEIPLGGDIDTSYTLNFLNARVHGGGYYYKFTRQPSNDIVGLLAGISVPITQSISIKFDSTYDNFNNSSALATLSFNFGSSNISSNRQLANRLNEKTQRHFGTIYNGSGTPTRITRKNNLLYQFDSCGTAGSFGQAHIAAVC